MATEDVPTWVKVSIGVALFAVTIGTTVGGVAWAMSRESTAHGYVVDSLLKTDQRHDEQITKNSQGIARVVNKQHEEEVARAKMQGKVDNIETDVSEIKKDFREFTSYLMQFDYDKKKETE